MSLCDKELEKLLTRLTESIATSIDLKEDETVNFNDDEGFGCLRCGYVLYATLLSPFAYCPKCGRKVVEVKE